MKKILAGLLIAGGVALARTSVLADAMYQWSNDMGWSTPTTFQAFTMTASEVTAADAPEQPRHTHVVPGGSGGTILLYNTTDFGNFVIAPRDWSSFQGGALRFWLRSNAAVSVGVGYNNTVTFKTFLVASTGGNWVEQVIPFSSFSGGGLTTADLSQVTIPFRLVTASSQQLDYDDIRWTKQIQNLTAYPSASTVGTTKHRQFTVEGVNHGETMVLYAGFSANAAAGSVTPTAGTRASVLTAAGSAGSGNVTGTVSTHSVVIPVTVTASPPPAEFGLLSETILGLNLDVDSTLETAFGGGGSDPTLATESGTGDNREGDQRMKVSIPAQSGAGAFSGFYFQWGLTVSSANYKDMSDYYDGSIRLWIKAPSGLAGKLQVGMRSANVRAGFEQSKVLLTNANLTDGAANLFDNQWHPIKVPISQFAGGGPFTDLGRVKVLATFFVLGTVGATDFYVDNIRLDTRNPGTLARVAVVPNAARIPVNVKRSFIAKGFDSANVPVDVYANWDFNGGSSLGTLSTTSGVSTRLTAQSTPVTGFIRATDPVLSLSSAIPVTVANVVFTQSYNVYSDAGAGGSVGVAVGGKVTGFPRSDLGLQEPTGGAPEGTKFMRSTYTLVNNAGQTDAFGVWFVEESLGGRYLGYFSSGYLKFFIRTNKDLQVSLRSANIAPGAERCKFRLSDLGIPLDNTWQEVFISLEDFKTAEPLLDFNQIKTYFTIGALSTQIGQVTDQTFDVDDVKWLTDNPDAPVESKIYAGLVAKQHPTTGLTRSFDNDASSRSVTYDNALAAMNYTYRKDTLLAKKIFDYYKARFDLGGFSGFHDEYKWDVPNTILVPSRTAGPNAFMLLALIHYRNVTGQSTYNAMIAGIASWLQSLQDGTGAVRFGFDNAGTPYLQKSTEHNMDCYAAFQAYATMSGNAAYNTHANNVRSWLQTMWVPAQNRFNIGIKNDGTTVDTDKALDVYSWAPLSLSSFTSTLAQAVVDFNNTKVCDLTGLSVDGFDFGGVFGVNATYKDAVWLEGTAQMVSAYWVAIDSVSANHFIQELDKAVVATSLTTQGLAYATNGGTGYGGFLMDSLHPATSSMAWYLFAKKKFNPFRPFPFIAVDVRNISNNVVASSVTWTVSAPASGFVRANQYIRIDAQPISIDSWGIQVYTDNKNPLSNPRYEDPTPGNLINEDSNPAGMMLVRPSLSSSTLKIPMAWRIQDSTASAPAAIRPYTLLLGAEAPEAFNWSYFKDKSTPPIDANGNGLTSDAVDGTAFSNGEEYMVVRSNLGIHSSQGPTGYSESLTPDALYLEADFSYAPAQVEFRTSFIIVEFFTQ